MLTFIIFMVMFGGAIDMIVCAYLFMKLMDFAAKHDRRRRNYKKGS